ncbi:secreted antigen 1 [Babesia divergens]|uniref:Secreted antigen 1 n=1 Tax=Babesia divergens TaxID=32595 RepID=A0AAD9GF41_BABDI|nr:secreted antigen 1 [Babesia divergens]
MKFLGILRSSTLCLLAIGFHGQPVSCGVFKSNIKSKEDSNVKVSVPAPGSAPVPESGLVFENSSWHDSQLASAVLFLEEFCKEVKAKKFDEHVSNKILCKDEGDSNESDRVKFFYGELAVLCSSVSKSLESLYKYLQPSYGPGTVDERKEIDMNSYKGLLKPEKLYDYINWLANNNSAIKKSLGKMLKESVKLTEEQIKTDTSVGPLKYGFVYVYKGSWWSRPCYKNSLGDINGHCRAVMRSLASMKYFLGRLDERYEICLRGLTKSADNISEHIPEESSGVKESELSENLAGSPVKTDIVEEGVGNETENLL